MADQEFSVTPLTPVESLTQFLGANSDALSTAVRCAVTDITCATVTWFGADNTGVEDSSPAIADALAFLPAEGGVIYFPEGSYTALNIDVPNGVRFVGSGISSTKITALGEENATNHLFNRQSTAAITFGGIEHMTLQGGVGEGIGVRSAYNGVHLRNSVGFAGEDYGRFIMDNVLTTGFRVGVHGTVDDRHLATHNSYYRNCETCLFITHHCEFMGKNDFRHSDYGIGHGAIRPKAEGGTSGLFDQGVSNLKVSTDYGIWPLSYDDNNDIHTNTYAGINNEPLLPMRACNLSDCLFSNKYASIAIGDWMTVSGNQFIHFNDSCRGFIFIGGPDEANSFKHIEIGQNSYRANRSGVSKLPLNTITSPTEDIFGNSVSVAGSDIDGACIVIDASNGLPTNITIDGGSFDFDDCLGGSMSMVRIQDSSDIVNPPAPWFLNIGNLTWRHKPTGTADYQLIVCDTPNMKVNMSQIHNNSVWIDSNAGGVKSVIQIDSTSATFPVDYSENLLRVDVGGRYAIEAEAEDGTIVNNRVFHGAGFNFSGFDANCTISANPTDGVRAAGNIYNS